MSYNVENPLLTLPAELRIAIYRHAFEWPDFKQMFENAYTDLDIQDPGPKTLRMRTPSLLLLNRQIWSEARNIAFEKAIIIDAPPPYNTRMGQTLGITSFIGKEILQKLRFVVLKMDLDFIEMPNYSHANSWLLLVKDLLEIWCENNCLERIEAVVYYELATKIRGWTFQEANHHRCVMDLLSRLRAFGEKYPVVFSSWGVPRSIAVKMVGAQSVNRDMK